MSWITIRIMERMGLAWDVIGPRVTPDVSSEAVAALLESDTREANNRAFDGRSECEGRMERTC